MNIEPCETCGVPVIKAVTAAKGKGISLATSFSTTEPKRFYMKDGKAVFCDAFDRSNKRQGYPFHDCEEAAS